MNELEKLSEQGVAVRPYGLTATIHTIDKEIVPLQVTSFDTQSDYVNNIGEYYFVELLVGLGTWVKDIYPYIQNLEVTISIDDNISNKTVKRYKAVFIKDGNVAADSGGISSLSRSDLDTMSLHYVRLQLIDRCLEVLRLKDCSGIYKDTDIKTVLAGELYQESQQILVDNNPIVKNLIIDTIDNKNIYPQIVLPDKGTRLISLVNILQNTYGVYSTGIGVYYLNNDEERTLYVYTLYNTKKDSNNKKRLKVVNITDRPMSLIDKSYYIEDNVYTLFCGAESKVNTDGEAHEMQEGTGFRLSEDRNMMGKPVPLDTDKPTANRYDNNYELRFKDREDGVSYTRYSTANNPLVASSDISIRMGNIITVNWTYSNHTLLVPGMPVIYTFKRNNKYSILHGELIAAYTHIGKDRIPQTSLSLFLERYES